LPDGTLLGPRILSSLSDAPYLGEAALLFALTRKPIEVPKVIDRGKLPWSVYAGILLGICLGMYEILATILRTRRWHKRSAELNVPAAAVQVSAWSLLIIAAVLAWTMLSAWVGFIILLAAQLLPFWRKPRPKTADPDNQTSG